MAICSRCGKPIESQGDYCPFCGSKLAAPAPTKRPAASSPPERELAALRTTPPRRSLLGSILRIAIGVVAALLIIGVVVWALDAGSESDEGPGVTLSAEALSAASIKEALGEIEDIGTVEKVVLDENADGTVVAVTYNPGEVWDADAMIEEAARVSVAGFATLFAVPEVAVVRMIARAEFTDAYGKDAVEEAVQIDWKRATANKVDFAGLSELLWTEPQRAYELASSYSIHAAVLRDSSYGGMLARQGP